MIPREWGGGGENWTPSSPYQHLSEGGPSVYCINCNCAGFTLRSCAYLPFSALLFLKLVHCFFYCTTSKVRNKIATVCNMLFVHNFRALWNAAHRSMEDKRVNVDLEKMSATSKGALPVHTSKQQTSSAGILCYFQVRTALLSAPIKRILKVHLKLYSERSLRGVNGEKGVNPLNDSPLRRRTWGTVDNGSNIGKALKKRLLL